MAKDKTPKEEAIALVQMLEARTDNPHQVAAWLGGEHAKSQTMRTEDKLKRMHVLEIASAYSAVSDGHGGVKHDSHSSAVTRYNAAVDGFEPNGKTPLASQRIALLSNRPDLLTDAAHENLKGTHGSRLGRVEFGARQHNEAMRPSRGFATAAMMATTAAITAIAIPALQHLGVNMKEEPAIRMSSLTEAASGLSAAEPAKLRLEAEAPGALAFAALRAKPPVSSGPK